MNRKQRRATAKLDHSPTGKTAAAAVPAQAADLVAKGRQHHHAGRLSEAESCYRRALAAHPDHPDALHLLGVIAHQMGHSDIAVGLISRAIKQNARNPDYFFNLGNGLVNRGKFEEAMAAYSRATSLRPDYAEAHFNLGNVLANQGEIDAAAAAYRHTITIRPNFAEAHSNLGNVLRGQGKFEEAIAAYRRALAIRPDFAEAHSNLGSVQKSQGKIEEAIAAYRRAISIKPDYAEAHFNLANALQDHGELDAAIAEYRRATEIRPDHAEMHSNLGNVLTQRGKLDEAIGACRRAIALKPDLAEAHSNLGNVLADLGRFDEAIAAYRRAVFLKPDFAEAHSNLGNALTHKGKLDEAIVACRGAIAVKPDDAEAHAHLGTALAYQGRYGEAIDAFRQAIILDPALGEAHSNFLVCLNYHDEMTADQVFAAHRQWGEQCGRSALRPVAYVNDRQAGRRLRIGYVSPDFRQHSVAYFLEPLLKERDRQAVEIFCYAELSRPDAVTACFQESADHWRVTAGLSDDELAQRIRADGIDILVDLAGHTAKNRLAVFARKPAPVQVTWLGYPNTTGLEAIDYRLVDGVTDPAGDADRHATETLVRLEGGFLCYAGAHEAPEPTPPPSLATGTVTFGSFNNPAKLARATLATWAALLVRLPQARLLLKGMQFADEATRALFLARLRERGMAEEQVEFAAWLPGVDAHLAAYQRVDIALDPFPYNGTTTTCEALWMGVPVVTLCGDRHAGRVGASLLGHIGLHDLIASSADEYVEIAVALAGDPQRLSDLRRSLRPRMAMSSLCDGRAFARKIESAFRQMWQQWCEKR